MSDELVGQFVGRVRYDRLGASRSHALEQKVDAARELSLEVVEIGTDNLMAGSLKRPDDRAAACCGLPNAVGKLFGKEQSVDGNCGRLI